MNNTCYIMHQEEHPNVALTPSVLAKNIYNVDYLFSNGTSRDKVTVIGRDLIGQLGLTDGTNKIPL